MKISTETEIISKNQTKILVLKNTVNEVKSRVESIKPSEAEKRLFELKDSSFEIIHSEEKKKEMKKSE